jgi:quercetin 2,3-dioxygenase
VTNIELDPAEIVCRTTTVDGRGGTPAALEVLASREVPLGGPRAMLVRRTLPQKGRTMIGPWCFADHYGPQDVTETGGMAVPPHPHTGLQTVSWLFSGEIEHRDGIGSHATVRPGELNLMTAGRGIAHSEVSTVRTSVLHGVQLWLALPDAHRETAPAFEHVVPPTALDGGMSVRVFLGSWLGQNSPATAFSPVVGAEVVLRPDVSVDLPLQADFEHGVLVDSGEVSVSGAPVPPASLGYVPSGTKSLPIASGPGGPARVLLLGGLPLGEQIVMWWNFIGRSHEEIVQYRRDWMAGIGQQSAAGPAGVGDRAGADFTAAAGRFGPVVGYPGRPLPAPEMPGVRLRPRT